jgi:periplasmic copper chaperone A
MRSIFKFFILFVMCLQAHAGVSVRNPWIRGMVPGQSTAVAYMTISSDTETQLIGGTTTFAETIEVHEMRMQDDIMRMRKLDKLDIKPGQPVVLGPSGYHLMLISPRKMLSTGDTIPVTLNFKNADGTLNQLNLAIPVKTIDNKESQQHQH